MADEHVQFATLDETLAADGPVNVVFPQANLRTLQYRPRGEDRQEPHAEDEVYIGAMGSALLVVDAPDGSRMQKIGVGDVAFVGKDVPHRFADISPDFAVWAVFA